LAGAAVKRLTDMMGPNGIIMNQTTSSNTQLSRYKADLAKLETRMEAVLARYTTMFANMDKIVGNANSMKTYLTNQFKAMSGSSG
jgi:flagellar capping protein FliD